MVVRIGDWIIKGVKGEFYPCKPDIFEQTYELVVEPPSTSEPEGATPLLLEACKTVMRTRDLVLPKGGLIKAENADEVRALIKMFEVVEAAISASERKNK